jgi:hypothetical protein
MPRPHILKKGETLAAVAEARLGDRKLARALADYNGLTSVRDAVVGQVIEIPKLRDLLPPKRKPGARSGVMPWPPAPHGFEAIKATFGDLTPFIRDDGTPDPKFEAQYITRAVLPYPVPYDPKKGTMLTKLACHKLVAPLFVAVFTEIANRGLKGSIQNCGGVWNWRMKRGQATKPSTHTWGIAIDLNTATNAMGTAGDMDPRIVEVFDSFGFHWGGRWSGANKDPMHFQYCTGY